MLQGHQSSLQHHWRDVFLHIQPSCATAQTCQMVSDGSHDSELSVTNASFSLTEQTCTQAKICSGQSGRGVGEGRGWGGCCAA